nr:hypothetical protein [Tanacetum cinerariifolium]
MKLFRSDDKMLKQLESQSEFGGGRGSGGCGDDESGDDEDDGEDADNVVLVNIDVCLADNARFVNRNPFYCFALIDNVIDFVLEFDYIGLGESEKEAIHLLFTGIMDEIYSTVDACKTAHEMWIAIERYNKSMESYYFRFYKMMNEMIRNNLTVATMQVNVQFLYQLQLEWLRQKDSQTNHTSTNFKDKKIAKPIKPLSESASEEDSDPKQAQRDKDMQKNLALIAKYKNDNQTGQFRNQRTMTVAEARETVGSQVVQQTGIQCFNCKEFGHYAKKCRKPKRVKNTTYHKEKMLCKQVEKEAHYIFMAKIQEVPNADSGTDTEPLEQVQNDAEYNVFANVRQHSEQPESTSNTCLVENDDSNVTPDSPNMRDNDIQTDQNAEDERVALANLITEFERYKALNDRIVAYDKLKRKLNETLGLLAQKEIDINKGLKVKAYEISLVKEKHDELIKQGLLTNSHFEGIVKEKTQVITDLKHKEEKDIDKMISMEKKLKFLNEIIYKRNQSIQTIHMLAPKGPTFNGRPTFANPMYLKMTQSEKPCLYEILNDQSDPKNRFVPDWKETLTLEKESRSKLNKDLVRPYDYTKLNSLYEIFKPASHEYHEQLAHANEVRKKM